MQQHIVEGEVGLSYKFKTFIWTLKKKNNVDTQTLKL